MKQAARWIAIIALFIIPFLPLYVPSELFFPFITGKNFAFRILVEIALASYVLLALLDKRYRPRFSWILVAFGGLVAWMVVANLFGVNPHKAFWSNFERMDGWVTLVHIFALFIVAGTLLTVEKLWRRWWLFFVSVATAVCAYGLVQLGGGAEIHQGSLRLTASLGNAIYLAVYLMFAIFAAGWLAIRSKGWARHALLAFIPLAGLVLFYTGSRGPLLGLVAGVMFAAVLWLFLSRKEWKGGNTALGLKLAAGALVAIMVLTGTLFLVRGSAVVQNNPFLSRAASVFSLNQELRVRSTIWGMALEGVKEDPLTGWGQEGFNQVFNKYYKPSLYEQETWFDRAHNMYIDWLVAGGIPAFVLFVALLLLAMFSILRASDMTRAERVLLISALVAYAVQALVVFDNLFSYVPLVMLIAMAHAASGKQITRLENLPEVRSQTGVAVAGLALIVCTIVIIWTVNVPSMRAAHHLIYAISPNQEGVEQNLGFFKKAVADGSFATQEIREQLVMFAAKIAAEEEIPAPLRKEIAMFALEEMEKEVAASPNDARLRIQYAAAFDTAGFTEESLAQIERGITLSPQKQVLHLNRAYRLYDLGRREDAVAAYQYAYELDPSFQRVAIATAAGIILSGDLAAGKAILMEALGTTTPHSESLFYAYYMTKQWNDLIAVAQAAVLALPEEPAPRLQLAQAYAAAGRFNEARAEILATIKAHPEVRASAEELLARMFATQ